MKVPRSEQCTRTDRHPQSGLMPTLHSKTHRAVSLSTCSLAAEAAKDTREWR
jgi:hypothetical protein